MPGDAIDSDVTGGDGCLQAVDVGAANLPQRIQSERSACEEAKVREAARHAAQAARTIDAVEIATAEFVASESTLLLAR